MPAMHRLRLAPLVIAVAVTLAACGGSDDGGGGATNETNDTGPKGPVGATVILKDLKFDPETVTIEVGESVKWEWKEKVLHNVHGDGFESPNQTEGTFSHTFDEAGSFDYQCTLHSGMTGTVEVEES